MYVVSIIESNQNEDRNALSLAADRGKKEICELLMSHGAIVDSLSSVRGLLYQGADGVAIKKYRFTFHCRCVTTADWMDATSVCCEEQFH